jgi:hypothetical protein
VKSQRFRIIRRKEGEFISGYCHIVEASGTDGSIASRKQNSILKSREKPKIWNNTDKRGRIHFGLLQQLRGSETSAQFKQV